MQIALSDISSLVRDLDKGAADQRGPWIPPNRFTRDTTKFWLKSENVTRFKVQLIQHLPLLIFDRKAVLPGKPRPCVLACMTHTAHAGALSIGNVPSRRFLLEQGWRHGLYDAA